MTLIHRTSPSICASISPVRKEITKSEIDRFLTEGIIEPCELIYVTLVVLISKPNGTHRFSVDYRKLNAITKTEFYSLAQIDEFIN